MTSSGAVYGGPANAPVSRFHAICLGVGRAIGSLTTALAAAVIVVLAVLLFANVVARYVIHSPIYRADELASLLFIWMPMFGAVVALARNEHMALKTVADRLPAHIRPISSALVVLIVAMFLVLIMPAAVGYFDSELVITLPSLEIGAGVGVSAIVVGCILMLIVALMKLLRQSLPGLALSAALLAVVSVAFVLAQPMLMGWANTICWYFSLAS